MVPELNALSDRRRHLDRQEDRRAALIAWTIAQSNGAKNVEIEDFMPKTAIERQQERQQRLLAWVDRQALQQDAQQGSH